MSLESCGNRNSHTLRSLQGLKAPTHEVDRCLHPRPLSMYVALLDGLALHPSIPSLATLAPHHPSTNFQLS